jgi:hypothetical protein
MFLQHRNRLKIVVFKLFPYPDALVTAAGCQVLAGGAPGERLYFGFVTVKNTAKLVIFIFFLFFVTIFVSGAGEVLLERFSFVASPYSRAGVKAPSS